MEPTDFSPLQVIWDLPNNWCEEAHLSGALHHAGLMLQGLGLAERFVFVVTSVSDQIPMKHPDRVVVLQTSDEGHEIPDYLADAFMVFKNYKPFDGLRESLRVIPLGCNKDVPAIPGKPMAQRELDLFFIGRPDFREEFFAGTEAAFSGRDDITFEIGEAPGFRLGRSPEDYARRLADTKIALSPRGVSHETFRTYEALRAGCVVIAQRQLSAWFTEGWPVIEVDDWSDVGDLADDLLGDSARLEDLSRQSLAWWQEKCSEEAVAHYVVRELAIKLIGEAER